MFISKISAKNSSSDNMNTEVFDKKLSQLLWMFRVELQSTSVKKTKVPFKRKA